jgi:hypothetical protein
LIVAAAIGPFPGIHFVELSMQGAAADAEFFGSGGDVAV